MEETEVRSCLAVCLADSLRLMEAQGVLGDFPLQAYRSELLVRIDSGWAVLFDYGVVVYWNVPAEVRQDLRRRLEPFAKRGGTELEVDRFSFSTGAAVNRIANDHIELVADEPGLLLAVSHAMAQSIKLAVFEVRAVETIQQTRHLPESLAQRGRIAQSPRQMAQIRGQLFMTRSGIVLHYDLLDTPEFFWENPEFQNVYRLTAEYLEIQPRTEVLSKKLETIHELLEMLADEQKHRHSSTLEWIIIWLIAAEILMTLIKWAD